MAYNFYQVPQQFYPQQQVQYQQQMQNLQTTQNGFMSMPSEQDARNYPVAPGNVMTFKIENQPIVCEKAQGFSQLEGPVFTKYRLIKEEDLTKDKEEPKTNYIDKSELNEVNVKFKSEIDTIRNDIKSIKADVTKLMSAKKVKREVIIEDDDE